MATIDPRQLNATGAPPAQRLIDAPGEVVEVVVVDPRFIGRRVDLGTREYRGDPIHRVGVEAVARRQPPHARPGAGVDGYRADQLIERRTAGGDITGEEFAFGVSIPLADRQ